MDLAAILQEPGFREVVFCLSTRILLVCNSSSIFLSEFSPSESYLLTCGTIKKQQVGTKGQCRHTTREGGGGGGGGGGGEGRGGGSWDVVSVVLL